MLRLPLLLACSFAAMAQTMPQAMPQQEPMDAAMQQLWRGRPNLGAEELTAARNHARDLLQHAPVDSPRFPGWVQGVAQEFQNSDLHAQARAILLEALERTTPLGNSHPSHTAILAMLGDSWLQDGNLLKAVGYLEQSAAAQSVAPPPAAEPVMSGFIVRVYRGAGGFAGRDFAASGVYAYTHLASVYQRLGRPDAVAAIAVKIRALAANDESALARFYEEHAQFDEAAAIYKKLAEQATDAQAGTAAWQSLANLYAVQERYTDAAAAMQKAIAAAQSVDNPGVRIPAAWMHQNLASYLRQAGKLDQADLVYQQILQQNRGDPQENQFLGTYAQYLAETQRGEQGESLLKDYLAQHPAMPPELKWQVLYTLANVARTANLKGAEEYQNAAIALQPASFVRPANEVRIEDELLKAQATLQAIDTAAHATDGEQSWWIVSQIARALAAHHEPAKAEQVFQRLLALGQRRSADRMQTLTAAAQSYANFLSSQPDRLADVPAAIEQYRRVLTDANGPDSASLAEPVRMTLQFEQSHSQWDKADASARELLELQESLSGNTSEHYLADLQSVARMYESAGDSVRALALFRKAIPIADLLVPHTNDWNRSQTRMETALVLARLGQFDEAETLGQQAITLQSAPRTPAPPLSQQLEQIRQMKQAAATAAR
jgi:tetratricopeptide (TPR) repeat protein